MGYRTGCWFALIVVSFHIPCIVLVWKQKFEEEEEEEEKEEEEEEEEEEEDM